MFENPRRGRQARNFTTNVPKILVLKSSSEQIFSPKLPLGAPVLCQACFCSGPASYSKWQESPWLVFLACNLLIEAFFFPVERVSLRTGKGESFLPGITTKLKCDSGATGQPDLSFWENAFFTEIFCQKPVTVVCKRLTLRLPSPCTASSQAFFVNAFSVTYPRRWSLGTWQIRRDSLANVIANVTKGP